MNLKKIQSEKVLGTLVAISYLILPNSGFSFFGINLEDAPLILIFIYLSYKFITLEIKKKFSYLSWITFIFLFSVYIIIFIGKGDYFNKTNIRFIYFLLFCFLIKNFFESNKSNLINFYKPLAIVTLVNFINIFVKYNFDGSINGWIPSYTNTSNLFSSGRLGGFQGSGPNVFGFIAAVCSIVFIYELLTKEKNISNIIFFIVSFTTLIFSKSRGSILAFFIGLLVLLFLLKLINFKISLTTLFIFSLFISYFSYQYSEIILRDNDRQVLLKTGIENINFFSGTGGGEYIYEVYKDSFKYLNLDELEKVYGVDISKISSDIAPVGFENNGSFIYKDSLNGYKLLNKFNLIKCDSSYVICKTNKVPFQNLIDFFVLISEESTNISEIINICNVSNNTIANRNQLNCLASNILLINIPTSNEVNYPDLSIKDQGYFNKLSDAKINVPCEETDKYACPKRELNYGELSYFFEKLNIENIIDIENLENKCIDCNSSSNKGKLMLNFDYIDKFLPRSKVTFYIMSDNNEWKQIGEEYTPGYKVDLVSSNSIIEIGGWADGQSFGDSFLGAVINSVEIKSDNFNDKITFNRNNLSKEFKVLFPNTLNEYINNITFLEEGIKAYNPNKYWISTIEKYDLSKKDFQIILYLNLDEIPVNKQVLASQSSLLDNSKHSWQWYIQDSRMFFTWADDQGVYREILGDRSYRSGILISKDGQLDSQSMIIDNNYNLNQITTAHNGFVTFSVEYGLFATIALLIFLFINIKQNIFKNKLYHLPTTILIMFLVQNLTNDLIYSPDASIIFWLSVGLLAAKKTNLQ